MANSEHVRMVQSGADATWNWRGGRLDLGDADLSGVSLRGALLDQADLHGARLIGTDLTGSRLQEANLAGAHLIRAVLNDARLGGSRLVGALLCSASLRRAVLVRCDLTGANLAGADFEAATLAHARLAGALFDRTKLVDAELDGVCGLDQVIHEGPSELGTHALLRFGNQMPASFLRGVGLPDSFIHYLPSIIASAKPVDFYSTFICAAPAHSELARRLHNDLQAAGVRCWFRHPRSETADLDDAIRLHDRSLVLVSRDSLSDPAVMSELHAARRSDRGETMLIATDDSLEPPRRGVIAELPDDTLVFDFRRWEDFRRYSQAFDRLLQCLLARE